MSALSLRPSFDVVECRNKIILSDEVSNHKLWWLYVVAIHWRTASFLKGLVAYKRPLRVVGAERQKSFIIA